MRWSDGYVEPVDATICAPRYCANLDFLRGTGALDTQGQALQRLGRSLAVPGFSFADLSVHLASTTLRGGQDAAVAVHHLTRLAQPH